MTRRIVAAASAAVAKAAAETVLRATGAASSESSQPCSSAPASDVATQRIAKYASAKGSTMLNISACMKASTVPRSVMPKASVTAAR